MRLGRDADGDGGRLHELRVRRLFAGEHHDGPGLAGGEELVQALLPGAQAAEETDDDQVGAVQQGGQLGEVETGGVGEPVRHGTGGRAGAQQVGVGRRQQQDHGGVWPSSGSAPRAVSRTAGVPGSPGGGRAHSGGTAPGFHRASSLGAVAGVRWAS